MHIIANCSSHTPDLFIKAVKINAPLTIHVENKEEAA